MIYQEERNGTIMHSVIQTFPFITSAKPCSLCHRWFKGDNFVRSAYECKIKLDASQTGFAKDDPGNR